MPSLSRLFDGKRFFPVAKRRQAIAWDASPRLTGGHDAFSREATTARSCGRQPADLNSYHDLSREAATEGLMGSFTQLNYHIVFSTKHRRPEIDIDLQARLCEYFGGTIRGQEGQSIEIGGTRDHVHILTKLSPTMSFADVIRDLKSNSSKWISELPETRTRFEWQKGYSAFTVSYSQIDAVQRYIRGQEEQHRTKSFHEEYEEFLKRHDIEYRPE